MPNVLDFKGVSFACSALVLELMKFEFSGLELAKIWAEGFDFRLWSLGSRVWDFEFRFLGVEGLAGC